MAKNITLMGADYPDVPAVQLPQTGGGTATFYDINVVDNLNSESSTDALSAKQGKVLNEKTTVLKDTVSTNIYTGHTTDNVNRVFKVNDIATIEIDVEAETGYTFPVDTNLFQAPSGYRPTDNLRVPAMLHHSTADVWVAYFVTIRSDGYIRQAWTSSCDKIWICASYPLS